MGSKGCHTITGLAIVLGMLAIEKLARTRVWHTSSMVRVHVYIEHGVTFAVEIRHNIVEVGQLSGRINRQVDRIDVARIRVKGRGGLKL